MYWQQQQPTAQAVPGGWNAPGSNSVGVTSWNGGSSSVVSQYDSSSGWQQQQQPTYQQHQQQPNNYQQQPNNYQQQPNNYQQQQPFGNHVATNSHTIPSSQDRVALYTQHYNDWKSVTDSSSDASQKQWATYYADLASRAAHYFHQNPTVTEPHPDMELPPPPPPKAAVPPPPPPPPINNPKSLTSDDKTFKSYLDRCLQQCNTPQEKEAMAEASKAVLKTAIQTGSLHTKDWSREPLLSNNILPKSPEPRQKSPPSHPQSYGYSAPDSSSHYGPAVTNSPKKSKSSKKKNSEKKRPLLDMSTGASNGSYYGPSVSSLSFSGSPNNNSKRVKPITNVNAAGFNNSSVTLNRRMQRFASSFREDTGSASFEEDSSKGPIIIGTCQVLEKEYLRLTSAPKAELVRPQPILERHFANLKSEYADIKHRHDYLWFCSQLKAIRQDCTVQHLKNKFCVQVYEFHAKVALEQGDLNEFNQCQTQLKYLYPALKSEGETLPNRSEFVSYRILYAVYMNLHSEKATIDMKDILGNEDLSLFLKNGGVGSEDEGCKSVKHALAVLNAAQEGNYHVFFSRLFPSQFGHQDFFLNLMIPVMRKRGLETLCGAYRPTLDAEFVCERLQLSVDKEGIEWLEQAGCIMERVASQGSDGQPQERVVIKTKESQIKMPEDPKKESKLM